MKYVFVTLLLLIGLGPLAAALIDLLAWFFVDHSLLVDWVPEKVMFALFWTGILGLPISASAAQLMEEM